MTYRQKKKFKQKKWKKKYTTYRNLKFMDRAIRSLAKEDCCRDALLPLMRRKFHLRVVVDNSKGTN